MSESLVKSGSEKWMTVGQFPEVTKSTIGIVPSPVCAATVIATLGEAFSFLSGLYFRGKLAYATAFAQRSSPPSCAPSSRNLGSVCGTFSSATRWSRPDDRTQSIPSGWW